MQVALAWLLGPEDLIVIPKATSEAHLRENVGALPLSLDAEDHADIDRDFPPPRGAVPLEIL
jgi:diketogulonate reductase-like aldo/keto reductase